MKYQIWLTTEQIHDLKHAVYQTVEAVIEDIVEQAKKQDMAKFLRETVRGDKKT